MKFFKKTALIDFFVHFGKNLFSKVNVGKRSESVIFTGPQKYRSTDKQTSRPCNLAA